MITERPESRARNLALVGLVFEVLLTAFFAVMSVWTQSEALRGLLQLSTMGTLIWLYLALVYHQRVLVQRENLETEQLRREQQAGLASGAIFDVDKEELLLAQRRLRWMYRWLLPSFTILLVVLLFLAGLMSFKWGLGESLRSTRWPDINKEAATLAIWFVAGAALLTFLLSRYASGLARYPEWRVLRSGASWLMGLALGSVAVSGTLAPLHYSDTQIPERVLAYVLRLLILVLAAEILFNFVLDFYRPRKPDEEPRPAFDSRLLGLFSEPGGIARSIADAVNYQFGFEVSSTWLYQLLERSALPLTGFAVLVLFLASSLVIVQADQQAVVERFGRQTKVLEPGLWVKYPWPIEVVYKVSTQQVHEFRLGDAPPSDEKEDPNALILWTNKHSQEPHLNVLISTPELMEFMTTGASSKPAESGRSKLQEEPTFAATGAAVSVSLLRVAITIHYQINDAKDWLSTYTDPELMLKAIASHELTSYCASQNVESMLGRERGRMEQDLKKRIEAAADKARLGIKIRFLGLQGVHPPEDTAEAFQDVIGAEQKKTASIRNAWADYNKRLSEVAGDVDRAEGLDAAVRKANQLAGDPKATEADRATAREEARKLFFGDSKAGISPIGGQASGLIAKARADRWLLENDGFAKAAMFQELLGIKQATPKAFFLRERLKAMAQGLEGIRKYVLVSPNARTKVNTYQVNLQDPVNAAVDFRKGSE